MKIAIIGAGAAGLTALKESLDEGHTCELFERTGYIGGTWKYDERVGLDEFGLPIHTSLYEGLRTNSPKELLMFEDFPYRKGLIHSYISHQEVYEYIEAYVDHFQLKTHIKLFHHLEDVTPIAGARWLIRVKNLKTDILKTKQFDGIMICVGHYSTPVIPELSGKFKFGGSIIHSHDYRTPNPYKNRKVLIVGVGPSGLDIAVKVMKVAKKVIQCYRTLKSIIGDKEMDLVDGVIRKPEIYEMFEKSVKFIDGSAEEIDDVILCTGYKFSLPFLTPECGIHVSDDYIKYLYKHTINIEQTSMAILGMPKNLPLFSMFCLQARFFLSSLKGNLKVTKAEMRQDVNRYIDECIESGLQPHMNVFKVYKQFFEDLASLANVPPIRPAITKLFDYLVQEALMNFKISYRILNDDEFEHFCYDDIDVIRN